MILQLRHFHAQEKAGFYYVGKMNPETREKHNPETKHSIMEAAEASLDNLTGEQYRIMILSIFF